MKPLERSASAPTWSIDCSPLVDTRAAHSTSLSDAEAFTSSTVTSERNRISSAISLTRRAYPARRAGPVPAGTGSVVRAADRVRRHHRVDVEVLRQVQFL